MWESVTDVCFRPHPDILSSTSGPAKGSRISEGGKDRRLGSRKQDKESTCYRRKPDRRTWPWPDAFQGDGIYKAGSTRDIGAVFQPEGGIFFIRRASFHDAVQRNSLLFFFAQRCRKNFRR
jgi:hypothetical protein